MNVYVNNFTILTLSGACQSLSRFQFSRGSRWGAMTSRHSARFHFTSGSFTSFSMRSSFAALACLSFLLVCTAQPSSAAVTYLLKNQRAGTDYGLRLDNLITTGFYFFDFEDPGSAMFLEYDAATKQIRIFGVAYGGRSGGSRFSTDDGESGYWDINFTYRSNVQDNGSTDPGMLEIMSSPANSVGNNGSIQLRGGYPAIMLYEDKSLSFGGVTFLMKPDGEGAGPGGTDLPGVQVGRGWLSYNSNNSSTGAIQDWAFVAVVPEPSIPMAAGVGAFFLIARRRRSAVPV